MNITDFKATGIDDNGFLTQNLRYLDPISVQDRDLMSVFMKGNATK